MPPNERPAGRSGLIGSDVQADEASAEEIPGPAHASEKPAATLDAHRLGRRPQVLWPYRGPIAGAAQHTFRLADALMESPAESSAARVFPVPACERKAIRVPVDESPNRDREQIPATSTQPTLRRRQSYRWLRAPGPRASPA